MLAITPGMCLLGGFGVPEKTDFFFKRLWFLKSLWGRDVDRARRGDVARGQQQVKELIPTNPSPGWLLGLRANPLLPGRPTQSEAGLCCL